MVRMLFLNSFRKHLLIAAAASLWLFVFLVFIAPFDASELPLLIRMEIMYVYGLIVFFCYIFWALVFARWSERVGLGKIQLDLLFYLLLYVSVLPFTVLYYKSEIVNGTYTTSQFIVEQYLPVLLVITPILALLRHLFIGRDSGVGEGKDMITLKGENKRDILRLSTGDLVCVGSSDNYIEVFYLEGQVVKKKLLRTTLKQVELDCSFLQRVHRSFLINPEHFMEWSAKDTIVLAGIEVPVSRQFRGSLTNGPKNEEFGP